MMFFKQCKDQINDFLHDPDRYIEDKKSAFNKRWETLSWSMQALLQLIFFGIVMSILAYWVYTGDRYFSEVGIYTYSTKIEPVQGTKRAFEYRITYYTKEGKRIETDGAVDRIMDNELDTSKHVLLIYQEHDPYAVTLPPIFRQFFAANKFTIK